MPPADTDDLFEALHAVLLWFAGGPWSEDRARTWRAIVGSDDATSVTLCHHIREVLRAHGQKVELTP